MSTYIPATVRQIVRRRAANRCGYCQSPQYLIPVPLEIEHVVPLSKGGTSDLSNLWLACSNCNRKKGNRTTAIDPDTGQVVRLFNPIQDQWSDHFVWSEDGLLIIGKSAIGRASILALGLNHDADVLIVRSYWIQAGWHPPTAGE